MLTYEIMVDKFIIIIIMKVPEPDLGVGGHHVLNQFFIQFWQTLCHMVNQDPLFYWYPFRSSAPLNNN